MIESKQGLIRFLTGMRIQPSARLRQTAAVPPWRPSFEEREATMTQDINGATRLICLFGDPVAHSKSPHLHNRAFERAGLNYAYMAFRVPGEDMKQATDAIRLLNMRGCNLTMPNKIAVIPDRKSVV